MSHVESFEYVFLGGGKGGKTLAMELARAGRHVTVVHDGARGARREDEDVSAAIEAAFAAEGIAIRKGARAAEVSGTSGPAVTLRLDDGGSMTGSHLLVATGRTPLTRGIGLTAAGVGRVTTAWTKRSSRR
ncbi:FAD-dependent oxidoreductase [Burkholderia plantarii]|uniref:Putative pyridine nucleotide-disulfideoxidoreductase n=1 Tax=Burkholderia plantarii TaxID=41899 RepID=A0A0B6S4L8_BURPL|nr:FAD-dependent oxidoreductase [Burkholderia plantarii]AJK47176.1 putative pyridine nucleotide-disulfideoxidoreductase [Burkholderia plantarii]